MRRGLLAVFLLALMTLAGCFAPASAGWGTGSGEVEVDFSTESTTVTSNLGTSMEVIEGLDAVGCQDGDLDASHDGTITFTGYLAASKFYDSHNVAMGVKGLALGVTSSVAIQKTSFSDAAGIIEGEHPRVDVKDWSMPLNPTTGAGTDDLDKLPKDSDTDWFVLGMIPTTESILDGSLMVAEVHKAVTVEGYLIAPPTNMAPGYLLGSHTADENCEMEIGRSHLVNVYVLVTSITSEEGVVTQSGEADDEWVMGDVPIFGRGGFIIFFLIFAVGGFAVSFMTSKSMMKVGAKKTLNVLMGSAGLAKVEKVKSDVKQAKAAGMESPKDRKVQARKEDAKTKPAEKKESTSDVGLAGFDLDSAIASKGSGGAGNEFGGGKSSVVTTDETKAMEQQIAETAAEQAAASSVTTSVVSSSPVAPQSSGVTSVGGGSNVVSSGSNVVSSGSNVVSSGQSEAPAGKRAHFSAAMSSGSGQTPAATPKKKVTKKRATKKAAAPEAAPEPVQEAYEAPAPAARETYDDDDDFEDFSF